MPRVNIGERLKQVLEDQGMTQRALSRLLGVEPQYVNAVVKGRSIPSVDQLELIADRVGVPLYYLLTDTPPDAVIVNGTPIEGPPEKVALVVRYMQDAGEFERRYGFPLSPNDELGLRTYGRSGPVVTTEAEALDAPGEVLRVRAGLTERLPVGV
jgi:transcriptional regulator with XRE-family HTH domain